MLTEEDLIDKTDNVCSELYDLAYKTKERTIHNACEYYNGYIQGCEDYKRRMRQAISKIKDNKEGD